VIRRFVYAIALAVLALALHVATVLASTPDPVVVYYNRACADCLRYIDQTVVPLLRSAGYAEPTYKDYINDPAQPWVEVRIAANVRS